MIDSSLPKSILRAKLRFLVVDEGLSVFYQLVTRCVLQVYHNQMNEFIMDRTDDEVTAEKKMKEEFMPNIVISAVPLTPKAFDENFVIYPYGGHLADRKFNQTRLIAELEYCIAAKRAKRG